MQARVALLGLCWVLSACMPASPTPRMASTPPMLRALRYTIRVDAALSQLSTHVCFEGAAPNTLVHATSDAVAFVRNPRAVAADDSQRAQPLHVVNGHMSLAGLAADSCVDYEVDLSAALEHDALLLAYPGDGSLLLSTDLFLWRPPQRAHDLRASARFVLPAGVGMSAPWPERDGVFELDENAFACRGHLVFGQFARQSIAVPGATLEAIVLAGFPELARTLIAPWLATAGTVASLPAGAFPLTRAQVIVVPTSPSRFPIHFGYTGRSGGASIVLFVPTDMDLDQFRADWIAVHEFSHLWHPFVQRDDAWLSEGLATYLQEILRVRAGLLSSDEAWQRLWKGAQLGRDTDQNLSQETRAMRHAGNYERVYWAGAAIALMADVELRRSTSGKVTLDTVLAGLARERGRFSGAVSAAELLRAMDRIAGVDVFVPIARRYLSGANLPDLTELYQQLGLFEPAGALRVEHAAQLGWIRDAIMASHTLTLPLVRSPG